MATERPALKGKTPGTATDPITSERDAAYQQNKELREDVKILKVSNLELMQENEQLSKMVADLQQQVTNHMEGFGEARFTDKGQFYAETTAQMLHALLNRSTSLPTPKNIAETATNYTDAIVEALTAKGVM